MIEQNISFQRNFEISHSLFACTLISCCSIVNDLRASRLSVALFARPCYYTTSSRTCQGVLKSFFNFFQKFLPGRLRACGRSWAPSLFAIRSNGFSPHLPCPLSDSVPIISHSHPFCQAFFLIFFLFGIQPLFVIHLSLLFWAVCQKEEDRGHSFRFFSFLRNLPCFFPSYRVEATA